MYDDVESVDATSGTKDTNMRTREPGSSAVVATTLAAVPAETQGAPENGRNDNETIKPAVRANERVVNEEVAPAKVTAADVDEGGVANANNVGGVDSNNEDEDDVMASGGGGGGGGASMRSTGRCA